jgi:ABC-type molybdenum transport system ATPase subunit/photorepair protein PhrA
MSVEVQSSTAVIEKVSSLGDAMLAAEKAAQAHDGRRRFGEVLLSVENVSLAFGGVRAISDVSFDIRKGEIRAIIGPNGAGKTSMLNVINGF